ncbi:MAG TPA: hypothetical protein VMC81_02925 [Rhodocyclaceae bacterium]|nr:hypothetical protein [Rhodocyclaceae bacterium]
MNQPHVTRRVLIASAIGVLLPVSAAHAVNFLGNKIDSTPSTAPAADTTEYWNLRFLGNSIPVAKRGAEGPVRMDTMSDPGPAVQAKEKLQFLGNTFWIQKPAMSSY